MTRRSGSFRTSPGVLHVLSGQFQFDKGFAGDRCIFAQHATQASENPHRWLLRICVHLTTTNFVRYLWRLLGRLLEDENWEQRSRLCVKQLSLFSLVQAACPRRTLRTAPIASVNYASSPHLPAFWRSDTRKLCSTRPLASPPSALSNSCGTSNQPLPTNAFPPSSHRIVKMWSIGPGTSSHHLSMTGGLRPSRPLVGRLSRRPPRNPHS